MSRVKKTLVLAVVCTLLLCACQKSPQVQINEPQLLTSQDAAQYRTTPTETGSYIKTLQGAAYPVYPLRTELSFDGAPACIAEVLVQGGSKVKQGDTLMIFTPEEDRVRMEELRLQLQRAKESLHTGKEEHRAKIAELTASAEQDPSTVTTLYLDKQKVLYEQYVYQAEREIRMLEEQIAVLEAVLKNDRLTAPFDGVIDSVASCRPGDPVDAGSILITMHSTDVVLLEVSDSLGSLRYNMEVTVEVGKNQAKKTYTGRVISADNILPASLSQNTALIALETNGSTASIAQSAMYYCNEQILSDVLVVDRSAIQKDAAGSYVYLLNKDTVQKRYIAEGLTNNKETWILDGISSGQLLILD